jgi:amino acid adenylation domain-containing protein
LELQSLRPWFARHGDREPQLVNMYGITETTVHVTYRPIGSADAEDAFARSFIGNSIPDLQVYIMDRHMRLTPVGVAGEMYVGGAGVARGYLNRSELSAQRFIPDPFSPKAGARLYRSGDLARRLADGDIEYLGRIDQQVKIRGFRIELGEIEAALRQHEAVRECVVIARAEESGDKRLVAYVVPGAGLDAPSFVELRQLARQTLPDYMIPAMMVLLDALPLTPSGKVDKRALPAPDAARTDARETYLAPRTTIEEVLAAIWSEVLGVEQVGIHDNYFNLGGDSIRSVRVLGLARERGLNLTLQDIFNHQTIYELARAIEGAEGDVAAGERSQPFGLVAAEDLRRLPEGLEDAYPLTDLQMGMLYHMEARPESPAYHNVSSYHVRAEFDADVLQEAVRRVVKRHGVLRTSFDLKSYGEPLQLVHREAELKVPVTDLRHLPGERQEAVLAEFVKSEWATLFDLARPPLIRLHIHRRTDDAFQLTLTECHAILDGWSLTSTFAEIFNTHYNLLEDAALPPEPPLPVAFRDYVFSERNALRSDACQHYWAQLLSDCAPTMLPRWRRDAAPRRAGRRIELEPVALDAELSRSLSQLAHGLAVPLKSVLFAAHLKVLSTLSASDDVLTGLSVNGRPEELGGEQVRGLFVKTVPFRLEVAGDSWVELIKETLRAEGEMLPYRHYPLSAIQRSGGGQELFETEFHFLHFHSVEHLLRSGKMEILGNVDVSETNFTLMAGCQVNPANSELTINLHCDTQVLSREQIEYMADLYTRTLRALCADPHGRHDASSLLAPAEQQRVLFEWNQTARDYPRESTIPLLFEEQAERTPQAVALVCGEQRLTYAELNARANQLAHQLRRQGIAGESLVGVMLERSVEMVVGLLAVLKAGAAYLPLDANWPSDRLSHILDETRPRLILTRENFTETLPDHRAQLFCVDVQAALLSGESRDNPHVSINNADNLAYVAYASGAEERPRAVGIVHRGVVRLVQQSEYARLDAGEVFLQWSPLSGAAAAFEIWGSLLNGGRLVLPEAGASTPEELGASLTRYGATTLHLTPGLLQQMLDERPDDLKNLRQVLLSGDGVPAAYVEKFLRETATCALVNLYGAAENTTFTCARRLEASGDPGASSLIGRPLANTQVYILDRHLLPVSRGVAGELYLGGDGLARGYAASVELTAERFIPHPHSLRGGERLYRTGDLCRYLEDGTIELVGRAEQWSRARGGRVRLGEAAPSAPEQGVRPFVAARTHVEQTLCELWMQVLGVERVGIHDHFLDLGGDSLLATQLISKVRHTFEIELPLNTLLTDPTVAGLAAHIEAANGAERVELNNLAAMLESLEQLSEQEARALLDSKQTAKISHD